MACVCVCVCIQEEVRLEVASGRYHELELVVSIFILFILISVYLPLSFLCRQGTGRFFWGERIHGRVGYVGGTLLLLLLAQTIISDFCLSHTYKVVIMAISHPLINILRNKKWYL